jgi:hypothetical protein
MIITNLGCYSFEDGEMILVSLHPGCTVEDVQENLGWKVKVASDLKTTEPPSDKEFASSAKNSTLIIYLSNLPNRLKAKR